MEAGEVGEEVGVACSKTATVSIGSGMYVSIMAQLHSRPLRNHAGLQPHTIRSAHYLQPNGRLSKDSCKQA